MPMLHRLNLTAKELAMACEFDPAATHASAQIIITLSALALFVGTKTVVNRIRKEFTELTVVVVGCGPIGLTAALIAAHSSKVKRIILYEELSKTAVENKTYQIAILPSVVSFLRSYSVDFDNLEGLWHSGSFYTRVGIYLEYIISILPLYRPEIVMKFGTKFTRSNSNEVDDLSSRVLVICCDGSNGQAARALGISDECIQHSSRVYGAVAALERQNHTLVPTPEKRVHNLTFDLTAYGNNNAYEEDSKSRFSLKLFGNSRSRFIALAVNRSDSKIVKALKTILDKSMMRNIFLKCFNTYKSSNEPSVSDSYCLNNMKFSPRLFEIKLSQRMESVAYVADCDLFVITEGEASRSYNFNTGMDVNVGLRGLTALQPFIDKITWAETEHSIMAALIYKMEHSDKICKDFLKHGLKEYFFSYTD